MFRSIGQVLMHVKHAPNTHVERGNNRDKSRTGDLVRAKNLQKFKKNRDFFRTRQKLCSFVTHAFRASGQVLVHVEHASNTYREGGNNRERSRTRDLERTKSMQKFEKNRDFFQSFSDLRSFVAHAFRPSGQVLVRVEHVSNTYREVGNSRERSRTRDLERAKSLQKIEKNHHFFKNSLVRRERVSPD